MYICVCMSVCLCVYEFIFSIFCIKYNTYPFGIYINLDHNKDMY